MVTPKKRVSILYKLTALFVLVSFTLLNSTYQGILYAEPRPRSTLSHHGTEQVDPKVLLDSLELPEALGTVQEVFAPSQDGAAPERLILYLQSAHANIDSETNTRGIIAYFQKEYGLPLVLLEGGEGNLDSLFFKSFPSDELKKKVLDDYLNQGDLSGGEAASILSEAYETHFYGIETQSLYERNKEAFLSAAMNEKEILSRLHEIETRLDKQAESMFSKNVRRFHESLKAFRTEEIYLLEYVRRLNELYAASRPSLLGAPAVLLRKAKQLGQRGNLSLKSETDSSAYGAVPRNDDLMLAAFSERFPELHAILTAQANEKAFTGSEFDIAMNRFIEQFQAAVVPKLGTEDQMTANGMFQDYLLGQLDRGALINQMTDLAKLGGFHFRVPPVLRPAARHAETLSALKGTKVFDELEALEKELRSSLPETEEERKILNHYRALSLLRDFAKLELLPKDWEGIRNVRPSELLGSAFEKRGQSNEHNGLMPVPFFKALDSLFASHRTFYRLAQKRDETLFQNALKVMDETESKIAFMATGGFHTGGITEKLKASGIPYVLIAPKISRFTEKSIYMNAMRGERSFMKYFDGSLWGALAKDYAAKLAISLKAEELAPVLKRWRDRIIQNSIAEGRVTQAGLYTRYVDALVQVLRKESLKSEHGGQATDPRDLMPVPHVSLGSGDLREQLERELNSFYSIYFDRIEAMLRDKINTFGEGLKKLWGKGDFSSEALSGLLDTITSPRKSNLAPELPLAGGPSPNARGTQRIGEVSGIELPVEAVGDGTPATGLDPSRAESLGDSAPKRAELRSGEQWFEKRVPEGIDPEAVRQGLMAIWDSLAEINRKLAYSEEGDYESDREIPAKDLSDQVINQYRDVIQKRFNKVILNGPMDAKRMEEEFLSFHQTLGREQLIQEAGAYSKEEYETEAGKVFAEMFSPEFGELLQDDPVSAAARAFVRLVNLQPFYDGNKRASSLIMNYILMKAGYTPFILDAENVVDYGKIVYPIREKNEINEDEFRDFLEDHVFRRAELRSEAGDSEVEVADEITVPVAVTADKLIPVKKKIIPHTISTTAPFLDVLKPIAGELTGNPNAWRRLDEARLYFGGEEFYDVSSSQYDSLEELIRQKNYLSGQNYRPTDIQSIGLTLSEEIIHTGRAELRAESYPSVDEMLESDEWIFEREVRIAPETAPEAALGIIRPTDIADERARPADLMDQLEATLKQEFLSWETGGMPMPLREEAAAYAGILKTFHLKARNKIFFQAAARWMQDHKWNQSAPEPQKSPVLFSPYQIVMLLRVLRAISELSYLLVRPGIQNQFERSEELAMTRWVEQAKQDLWRMLKAGGYADAAPDAISLIGPWVRTQDFVLTQFIRGAAHFEIREFDTPAALLTNLLDPGERSRQFSDSMAPKLPIQFKEKGVRQYQVAGLLIKWSLALAAAGLLAFPAALILETWVMLPVVFAATVLVIMGVVGLRKGYEYYQLRRGLKFLDEWMAEISQQPAQNLGGGAKWFLGAPDFGAPDAQNQSRAELRSEQPSDPILKKVSRDLDELRKSLRNEFADAERSPGKKAVHPNALRLLSAAIKLLEEKKVNGAIDALQILRSDYLKVDYLKAHAQKINGALAALRAELKQERRGEKGAREFKEWDRIVHTSFGAGTITRIDDETVTIRFDDSLAEPQTFYLPPKPRNVLALEADAKRPPALNDMSIGQIFSWFDAADWDQDAPSSADIEAHFDALIQKMRERRAQDESKLLSSGHLARLVDLVVRLNIDMPRRAEPAGIGMGGAAQWAELQLKRLASRDILQRLMAENLMKRRVDIGGNRLKHQVARLKSGKALVGRPLKSIEDLMALQKAVGDSELEISPYKMGSGLREQAVVISVGEQAAARGLLTEYSTSVLHTHGTLVSSLEPSEPDTKDALMRAQEEERQSYVLLLGENPDETEDETELAVFSIDTEQWEHVRGRNAAKRLRDAGVLRPARAELRARRWAEPKQEIQRRASVQFLFREVLRANLELMRMTAVLKKSKADGKDETKAEAQYKGIKNRLEELRDELLERRASEKGNELFKEILSKTDKAIELIGKRNGPAANASMSAAVLRLRQAYFQLLDQNLERVRSYRQTRGTFRYDKNHMEPYVLVHGRYANEEVMGEAVPVSRYAETRFRFLWEAMRMSTHQYEQELSYKVSAEAILGRLQNLEEKLAKIRDEKQTKGVAFQVEPETKKEILNELESIREALNAKWIIEKEITQLAADVAATQVDLGEWGPALTTTTMARNLLTKRRDAIDSMIPYLENRLGQMHQMFKGRNEGVSERLEPMEISAGKETEMRKRTFRRNGLALRRLRHTEEPSVEDVRRNVIFAMSARDIESRRRYLQAAEAKVNESNQISQFLLDYRLKFKEERLSGQNELSAQENAFYRQFQDFITANNLERGSPKERWWWYKLYQMVFVPFRINDPDNTKARIQNPLFRAYSILAGVLEIGEAKQILKATYLVSRKNTPNLHHFLSSIPEDVASVFDLTTEKRNELIEALASDFAGEGVQPEDLMKVAQLKEKLRARAEMRHEAPQFLEGVGERTPDWQRLNVVAQTVLDLIRGERLVPVTLDEVSDRAQKELNGQGLGGDDVHVEALLNRLVDAGTVEENARGYQLALGLELFAVKHEHVNYIRTDFEKALAALETDGERAQERLAQIISNYASATRNWPLYPVEARWPVLKAVALLSPEHQDQLVQFLEQRETLRERFELVDSIVLMLKPEFPEGWVRRYVPRLFGRTIYYISSETWLAAGGLGRVGQYLMSAMKRLAGDDARIVTIEPYYPYRLNSEHQLEPVDYETLAMPVEDLSREPAYVFEVTVRGKPVRVQVFKGKNKFGIDVYLIKDKEEFYTKLLYRYGSEFDSATWEEFTEFFSRASLELVRMLEHQEQDRTGNSYKPPVVWANDGQLGSFPVFKRILDSLDRSSRVLRNALVWMTTHTYRNRGIFDAQGGRRFLDGMEIPPDMRHYFFRIKRYDSTSGGLRTSDGANGVSAVHAFEVSRIDPTVLLIAVTNGDDRAFSAEVFRSMLKELFPNADHEHPTETQIIEVKKEAKRRLGFDPERIVISYSGRLVEEKAGRERAFTDANIRELVRAGAQVVIYGNVQADERSRAMYEKLVELAEDVNQKGPGRLIVETGWGILEQKALLAATDLQIQDSDRDQDQGTEAAGYTEADVSANAGLQMGPPWIEGIIQRQGIILNQDKSGSGNTLIPAGKSPQAYLNAMLWVVNLFHKDRSKLASYQAASVRISRVLEARLTAAEYLRQFENAFDRKEDPIGTLEAYASGEHVGAFFKNEWLRRDLTRALEEADTPELTIEKTGASSMLEGRAFALDEIAGTPGIVIVEANSRPDGDKAWGILSGADVLKHLLTMLGPPLPARVRIVDAVTGQVYGIYERNNLLGTGLPVGISRDSHVQILQLEVEPENREAPGRSELRDGGGDGWLERGLRARVSRWMTPKNQRYFERLMQDPEFAGMVEANDVEGLQAYLDDSDDRYPRNLFISIVPLSLMGYSAGTLLNLFELVRLYPSALWAFDTIGHFTLATGISVAGIYFFKTFLQFLESERRTTHTFRLAIEELAKRHRIERDTSRSDGRSELRRTAGPLAERAAEDVGTALADRMLDGLGLLPEGAGAVSNEAFGKLVAELESSGIDEGKAVEQIQRAAVRRVKVVLAESAAEVSADAVLQKLLSLDSSRVEPFDIWQAFLEATELPLVGLLEAPEVAGWVQNVRDLTRLAVRTRKTEGAAAFGFREFTSEQLQAAKTAVERIRGIHQRTVIQFQIPQAFIDETPEGALGAALYELFEALRNIRALNEHIFVEVLVPAAVQNQRKYVTALNKALAAVSNGKYSIPAEAILIQPVVFSEAQVVVTSRPGRIPGTRVFDSGLFGNLSEIHFTGRDAVSLRELAAAAITLLAGTTTELVEKRQYVQFADNQFRAPDRQMLLGIEVLIHVMTSQISASQVITAAA